MSIKMKTINIHGKQYVEVNLLKDQALQREF